MPARAENNENAAPYVGERAPHVARSAPFCLKQFNDGIKTCDIGLQPEAVAFYYDYRDKQETARAATFVGNCTALTNMPRLRAHGLEMNVWLHLRASIAIQNS